MNPPNQTWQYLFRFVDERAASLACQAHRQGVRELELGQREPDPERLARYLKEKTGWTTRPCNGELPSAEFFDSLARKEFPLGVRLRSLVEVFGAKDPDLWHEAYGHLPTLLDTRIAALYHWFGRAYQAAFSKGLKETATEIERLYWFTLEYGFLIEDSEPKILGAGLVASPLGIERYRRKQVTVTRFRLRKVVAATFDPHRFQAELFAIPDLEGLLDEIAETYRALDVGHPLN